MQKHRTHSAVDNMSGCRCVSNCRSGGLELDPGLVPYFCGDDMVILLHSPESFKKGCCQLQAKVCAQSTG